MSAPTAHVASTSCMEAFGVIRSYLQGAKPELAAQVPDADIEDEFGRFRLWAANIGALSRGHGSLDYRLRDAPVVLEGALKLLSELQQELHQMCLVLSGARLPYEAQISSRAGHVDDSDTSSLSSDSESSSDSSSGGDNEKVAPTELRRRVSALSNINDNLYRLSRSIRAPASHSRSLRALSYKLIDKETGVDVVQQFAPVDLAFAKDLFSQLRRNAQDQYGNSPMLDDADLAMIKRFAQGITRRRQQFLYWKHHRKKLGFHAEKEVLKIPKPAPTVHLMGDETRESVAGPRASMPMVSKAQTESSRPKTTLTETTATLFIAPITVPDGNQSVTSYATTARGLDGSRIEFPKLPKSIKKGKDFECPYCQMICPPHYQMPRAWRAHLLRDLRPYMCTHKHCQQPDELFATRQEWLNHEHTHQKVWQCPEHASTHFVTRDDLKEHLFAETHESLKRMGLEDLLAICEIVRPDSRTICPICFVEAGSSYGLENHLANHLERFAAFALPRDVDDEVEDESPHGSNMSEHAIARSDQSEVSDVSYAFAGEDKKDNLGALIDRMSKISKKLDPPDVSSLERLHQQLIKVFVLPSEILDKLNIDLQFKAVLKTIPNLLTELEDTAVSVIDEDDSREETSELVFQVDRLDGILQEYAVDYALDSFHPRLIDTDLPEQNPEDGRKPNQAAGEPDPSRDSNPDSVVNRTGPRLSTMDLNRSRTSDSAEEAASPIRDSSPDSIVNRTSSILSTMDLNRFQTVDPAGDEASPTRDSSPDSIVHETGPSLSTIDRSRSQAQPKASNNGEDDRPVEEPPSENMRRDSPPFLIANLTSLFADAFRIQQRLRDLATEDKAAPDAIVRLNGIFPDICLGITNLIKTIREGVADSYAVTSIEVTDSRCRTLFEDASAFLDKYKKGTRPSWLSRTQYRDDIEQLVASAQRALQEIHYILELQARGRSVRSVSEHGRGQVEQTLRPSSKLHTLPIDNLETSGEVSGAVENKQTPESSKESQYTDNIPIPGLEDDSEVGHEASEVSESIAHQRDSYGPTHYTPSPNLDSDPRIDDRPVKGILKPGRGKFPEDPSPTREGVAPLGGAIEDGIYLRPSRAEGAPPPGARWTKINRLLVNPEALEEGGERYEDRDDFVVVLRVLSKEEIQAYADATVRIRTRGVEDEAEDKRRSRRVPLPYRKLGQDGSEGDDERDDFDHHVSAGTLDRECYAKTSPGVEATTSIRASRVDRKDEDESSSSSSSSSILPDTRGRRGMPTPSRPPRPTGYVEVDDTYLRPVVPLSVPGHEGDELPSRLSPPQQDIYNKGEAGNEGRHTLSRDSIGTSTATKRGVNFSYPSGITDKNTIPERPYPPPSPRPVIHRSQPPFHAQNYATSFTPNASPVFPCTFAFAGCNSAFTSKDEWKRHVASTHMCFVYWECRIGTCSIPWQRCLFNREYLFGRHLRLSHPAPTGTFTTDSSVGRKLDGEAWDRRIKLLLENGKRTGRMAIEDIRCPVPGCGERLTGKWAWYDRMEHVSRHWEKAARGEEAGGWTEEGGGLLEWAIIEGAVKKVEGGRLVCVEGLEWTQPHLDDEKKLTYDDASGPWASSITPSNWDSNVVLDPFTFPKGVDPTTQQTASGDEENKPINDALGASPRFSPNESSAWDDDFEDPYTLPQARFLATHQSKDRGEGSGVSVKRVSEFQPEPHRPSSIESVVFESIEYYPFDGAQEHVGDLDDNIEEIPYIIYEAGTNPTTPQTMERGEGMLSVERESERQQELRRVHRRKSPATQETTHRDEGRKVPREGTLLARDVFKSSGNPPTRSKTGTSTRNTTHPEEEGGEQINPALDSPPEPPEPLYITSADLDYDADDGSRRRHLRPSDVIRVKTRSAQQPPPRSPIPPSRPRVPMYVDEEYSAYYGTGTAPSLGSSPDPPQQPSTKSVTFNNEVDDGSSIDYDYDDEFGDLPILSPRPRSTADDDGETPDGRIPPGRPKTPPWDLYEDRFSHVLEDVSEGTAQEAPPLLERQKSRLKKLFSRRSWTEKGKGEQKGEGEQKGKAKSKRGGGDELIRPNSFLPRGDGGDEPGPRVSRVFK